MIVGIDLGSTYSLVARLDMDGSPILLPDYHEADVFHTPSVVHLSGRTAYVGRMAEALLEQDPSLQVIRYFKRAFGVSQPIHYDQEGTAWYPEAIGALVLQKLRFDAESFASTHVEKAVITVPAHFNDPQRKAVVSAALLADLPILGLVEEPVAAALHYGVSTQTHDQVLVVYDFGGGTFDVTVLSMDAKGVYMLSKGGLTECGGKELDEKIGEMILDQFERALGQGLNLSARMLLEVRRVSEEIKIELCMPGKMRIRRLLLLGGQAVEVEITRRDFEAAISDLLDQTVNITLQTISEAGLRPADAHALLMVGGSSMVPAAGERMKKIFTGKTQRILYHEPSKAVAYGAAIHASMIAGEAEAFNLPPEFRGITGYNVGVRTLNPATGRVQIDTLIKKNMPLPARVQKTYYTTRANQERIVLELVQFLDARDTAVSIGHMVIGPLPDPRINYPILVKVEYREDSTVAVNACDAQTGVELKQVFGRDEDGGMAQLSMQRALVRSTIINNL